MLWNKNIFNYSQNMFIYFEMMCHSMSLSNNPTNVWLTGQSFAFQNNSPPPEMLWGAAYTTWYKGDSLGLFKVQYSELHCSIFLCRLQINFLQYSLLKKNLLLFKCQYLWLVNLFVYFYFIWISNWKKPNSVKMNTIFPPNVSIFSMSRRSSSLKTGS